MTHKLIPFASRDSKEVGKLIIRSPSRGWCSVPKGKIAQRISTVSRKPLGEPPTFDFNPPSVVIARLREGQKWTIQKGGVAGAVVVPFNLG